MNNKNLPIKYHIFKNFNIFEILYYSFFLNELFKNFLSNKLIKLNKFLIYFFKRRNYYEKNLFNKSIKMENFKINLKFNNHVFMFNNLYKLSTTRIDNIFKIKTHYLNFIKKIFNFFFLFNFYTYNENFTLNHNYRLIFAITANKSLFLNNNKFLFYWEKTFLFTYNIFYYNIKILIFGSRLLKKETLAFNWINSHFEINFWNYCFSFFIFKINKFNKKINFFYKKIKKSKINTLLVVDCMYHVKNLYYFKKHRFFSIGVVPSNMNPWLVSYPIPALSNHYFTQLFFLKLILLSYKYSLNSKYEYLRKIWTFFK